MDTRSKILTLDDARRAADSRALFAPKPDRRRGRRDLRRTLLPAGTVTPVTGYFNGSPAAHECVLRQTELAWTHEAKS